MNVRACHLVDAIMGDLDNIPIGSRYRAGSNPVCQHQTRSETINNLNFKRSML